MGGYQTLFECVLGKGGYLVSCTTEMCLAHLTPTPLNKRVAGGWLNRHPSLQRTGNSGLTALLSGRMEILLPCQFGDSIQLPFGYWPNALTTRLPFYTKKMLVNHRLQTNPAAADRDTSFSSRDPIDPFQL
jgi:hypothetical protein